MADAKKVVVAHKHNQKSYDEDCYSEEYELRCFEACWKSRQSAGAIRPMETCALFSCWFQCLVFSDNEDSSCVYIHRTIGTGRMSAESTTHEVGGKVKVQWEDGKSETFNAKIET
ncbi:unnamed protein product [Effrenium voratum]|uniref:Uncharacterized protein n=1 Tax=Effrenium voratum TaxID=2562239 RepID=A0AA36IZI6_9DINO|nr:unnamed protein product [Effrenium voratum]